MLTVFPTMDAKKTLRQLPHSEIAYFFFCVSNKLTFHEKRGDGSKTPFLQKKPWLLLVLVQVQK